LAAIFLSKYNNWLHGHPGCGLYNLNMTNANISVTLYGSSKICRSQVGIFYHYKGTDQSKHKTVLVKQVSTAPGNVQNTYREVQGVKCPGIGSTVSLQIAEVGPLYTQGPHLDVGQTPLIGY